MSDDEEDAKPSTQQTMTQPAQTAAAPRCGDGTCNPGETCSTCAQDCGACPKCAEAPACDAALAPPVLTPANPQLDVRFEWQAKEHIRERVRALVATGAEEARVLAAALTDPAPGESSLTTTLRALFAKHDVVKTTVRAQLARAGMFSPDAYRAHFPERKPPVRLASPMNGAIDCGAPKLSIRMTKITVDEEDDDVSNDIVYCSVTADAPKGSELKVTPRTPNLDEGDSHEFSAGEATVWGQQGPREPGGDLVLTYDCYEADTSDGYTMFLSALAREGVRYGRTVDESGWVSDVSGSVVSLLPLMIALDSDDHLFEARQVISAADHLKLTNGASWTVRKSGTHYVSDWDWTVHMQAWGCAANGGGVAAQDAGAGG